MAYGSSRKPLNASAAVARVPALRGKRVAAGLSGGIDSVVLLHVLHGSRPASATGSSAVHVHHGLSPNAGDWRDSARASALSSGLPFKA